MKTAAQIRKSVLALIKRGVDQLISDAEFNDLAREVFAFQFAHNEVYRGWCESRKQTPDTVAHWKQIPAVPTSAFKDFALACFPVEQAVAEFRTSGTTQEKAGRHYFRTLELYEAAIVSGFNAHLLPDYCSSGQRQPRRGDRSLLGRIAAHKASQQPAEVVAHRYGGTSKMPLRFFILTPSPREAPHSSLSHMMGAVLRNCRATDGGFFVADDRLQSQKLADGLWEAQERGRAVFLLGTAFAFVHFFDYCAENGRSFRLVKDSRAMETGGFKGKSREMSKQSLYKLFEQILGIPSSRVVNEYGMTELSTQFYDETIRHGKQTDTKLVPPWARVMIIDPRTGSEAVQGERGLIRVFDLANLYSVMAIQTEDIGVMRGEKFEVFGRATAAEARGCSIAADEMMQK